MPYKAQGGGNFNLWGLLRTGQALLEALDSDWDIILLDRGPFDRLAFNEALFKQEYISEEERRRLLIFSQELSSSVTNKVLFLCLPETSLIRDDRHSQDQKGTVMNPSFLSVLYESYQHHLLNEADLVLDAESNGLDEVGLILTEYLKNLL